MNSQTTWPNLYLRTRFFNFVFKGNLSTVQNIALYFCPFSPIYPINNIFLLPSGKIRLGSYLDFFNVPFCFLNLGHSYLGANQGLELGHLATSAGALAGLRGQCLPAKYGAYPVH